MWSPYGRTLFLSQRGPGCSMRNKPVQALHSVIRTTINLQRFDIVLTSIAGKSIGYYFLYGPEMDTALHEYRTMTGQTPMLPKWAYGLFQSKDRYVSLDEIQDIAGRYRREHKPLDSIVQDWFWWKTEGDPIFNSNYHDVAKDLDALHKGNVHAMISAWGLLDPESEITMSGMFKRGIPGMVPAPPAGSAANGYFEVCICNFSSKVIFLSRESARSSAARSRLEAREA